MLTRIVVDASKKVGEDAEGGDALLEVEHFFLQRKVGVFDEVLEFFVAFGEHGYFHGLFARLQDFHLAAGLDHVRQDDPVITAAFYHHLVEDLDKGQCLVVVV